MFGVAGAVSPSGPAPGAGVLAGGKVVPPAGGVVPGFVAGLYGLGYAPVASGCGFAFGSFGFGCSRSFASPFFRLCFFFDAVSPFKPSGAACVCFAAASVEVIGAGVAILLSSAFATFAFALRSFTWGARSLYLLFFSGAAFGASGSASPSLSAAVLLDSSGAIAVPGAGARVALAPGVWFAPMPVSAPVAVRVGPGGRDCSVLPADLGTLANPIQVAAGQIIATEITPTNTKVGDTLDISITVKNTSDKPLQSMSPEPGFTYVQGQTYFTQQFASDPGKWRVAIGTAGLDATEMPYRWGLGGDLAPGATTTVTGHVKITQDFKTTNFWAALIDEPSTIVQTGVGMTLVTSLPENLAIVAVDAANVRSGPSIASSVLDQVKYGTELQIIGQSADWFKIKLPDQREGWVAAGWIVTAAR